MYEEYLYVCEGLDFFHSFDIRLKKGEDERGNIKVNCNEKYFNIISYYHFDQPINQWEDKKRCRIGYMSYNKDCKDNCGINLSANYDLKFELIEI